jgi:hypothetical protein
MRIGFDVAQTCAPTAGSGWAADLLAKALVAGGFRNWRRAAWFVTWDTFRKNGSSSFTGNHSPLSFQVTMKDSATNCRGHEPGLPGNHEKKHQSGGSRRFGRVLLTTLTSETQKPAVKETQLRLLVGPRTVWRLRRWWSNSTGRGVRW